jgi:hypothetical protein
VSPDTGLRVDGTGDAAGGASESLPHNIFTLPFVQRSFRNNSTHNIS